LEFEFEFEYEVLIFKGADLLNELGVFGLIHLCVTLVENVAKGVKEIE